MAGTVPGEIPRHRGRGHARSLLPRQRGRVDPRTRPRPRHSVEGQLFVLAGTEGRAPETGSAAGKSAAESDPARTRMGAPGLEGPPVERQGASESLRGAELG